MTLADVVPDTECQENPVKSSGSHDDSQQSLEDGRSDCSSQERPCDGKQATNPGSGPHFLELVLVHVRIALNLRKP